MLNNTSFSLSAAAVRSNSNKTLSNAEILSLITSSKNGDLNARNELLCANYKLICKIAHQVKNPNADFEDLVTDGCIRFLEIINEYDPTKGFAISTFVWRPVLQAMHQGVHGYKKDIGTFLHSKNEAVEYLSARLDHEPTDQEIADFMGISLRVYNNRLNDLANRSEISFDSPVNSSESDPVSLQDFLPSSEDPTSKVLEEDERAAINSAWNRLSAHDKYILTFRDLPNGERMTLREAAAKSGMSRESIRLHEQKAKETFKDLLEDYGVFVA